MSINVLDTKTLSNYMDESMRYLGYIFPLVPLEELQSALEYSIKKRFKDTNIVIDNNYKNKKIESSLLQISEYILERNPIITASGVMFKNHDNNKDPLATMLQSFLDKRSEYKKKMYTYPKGSELFNKYNLMQLLSKIDSNSLYGAMGASTCIFYNLYVASSITWSAQSAISYAETTFEAFLANNVKFRNLDEVLTFIFNIEKESYKFDINKVIDVNISLEDSFSYIIETCGHGYKPIEEDLEIIWSIMSNMNSEVLTRIFFKNNLYAFMELRIMRDYIKNILAILETPYLDPNKPPKECQGLLNETWELIEEFVFYNHNYNDTIIRAKYLPRVCTIFMDTDSTCLHLDPWYHFVLEDIQNNNYNFKVMNQAIDILEITKKDEFGDFENDVVPFEFVDKKDYDFYSQDVIEKQRLINPFIITPQDNLRYSIINIMCFFLDKLINKAMIRYTKFTNSYRGDQFCRLIMKNEYLFKRVMLTMNKKNYASIIELQEGNRVPQTFKASLDIKGLTINKSSVNPNTQTRLKKLLYEEILKPENISHINVLKELCIFEKEIISSLRNGEKKYLKPNSIKAMSNYDDPMRIQGIKAAYVWNYLRESNMEEFDFSKKNGIDIIKVNIHSKNIDKMKDISIKNKLLELFKDEYFSKGVTSIAIPIDTDVPEWIKDFIDYNSIVNDNISNFNIPLDSIGIYIDNNNINYSNILRV